MAKKYPHACVDCGKIRMRRVDSKAERCRPCATKYNWKRYSMARTHGKSNELIYKVWSSMIERCKREDYVARGTSVCRRWRTFQKFYADMGNAPPGYQLHRIDNNKGYLKSNCTWVPAGEHSRIHNARNI